MWWNFVGNRIDPVIGACIQIERTLQMDKIEHSQVASSDNTKIKKFGKTKLNY